MSDFRKVTTVSNWGYWDSMDGKSTLAEGRYIVLWPDGTASVDDVKVDRGVLDYYDMGNDRQGPNHRAYVARGCEHCGEVKRIYLRDLGVELRGPT